MLAVESPEVISCSPRGAKFAGKRCQKHMLTKGTVILTCLVLPHQKQWSCKMAGMNPHHVRIMTLLMHIKNSSMAAKWAYLDLGLTTKAHLIWHHQQITKVKTLGGFLEDSSAVY